MKYLVFCAALNLLLVADTVLSAVSLAPIYSNSTLSLTIYNVKSTLELACNVNATDGEEVEIKWKKDGDSIESVRGLSKERWYEKYDKTKGTATLTITHTTEQDAGYYTCVAEVKQTQITNSTIRAVCNLKVKVPSNINVVEGEKLRIQCLVYGNPIPTVWWVNLDENITYMASNDRIKLSEDPEKNVPNAIFEIASVEMTDRAVYQCIAYSNLTETAITDTCTVRIKDKYAALWPFLGICAEVFILCAIILIYEKKRNKSELEESDTDQSPDQKNTPDHGKESNLRHRQ